MSYSLHLSLACLDQTDQSLAKQEHYLHWLIVVAFVVAVQQEDRAVLVVVVVYEEVVLGSSGWVVLLLLIHVEVEVGVGYLLAEVLSCLVLHHLFDE